MKRLSLLCSGILCLTSACLTQVSHHTFSVGENSFLLDGKPLQIISGEMHYARIPREYWRDRLHMARAMGLNTIATYVFWNYHEPEKGKYNFAGNADVARFVKTAQEEGLWVIIRPSPYACAEWEFGGYPWWLLTERNLKVRSKDPRYLKLTKRYFRELGKQLVPLQITRGGNIIMIQLENEYGSYGKDKEYLALNKEIIRESGFDVPLYTCDGPSQMPNGYLPGVLPAVNGLDNVEQVKQLINMYHDNSGPYFIAEWYPGWFDSWGLEHHTVSAEEGVKPLEEVLKAGISINMYMVHGGTTRAFMNGANFNDRQPYAPQTSSYDYDAPIDEAGNATHKYMVFRDVIRKHSPSATILPPVPARKRTIAIPPFRLQEAADIFSNLPVPTLSERPLSSEDLQQGFGYVLYRTHVKGPLEGELHIDHLRDYALVFINDRRVAVLDRRLNQESTNLEVPPGDVRLDVLVENLGRINYGPYLNDNRKGITKRVTLNQKELKQWEMFRLPFNDLSGLKFSKAGHRIGPVVRRGTFFLDDTADTFLDMSDWGKGCVWLNGHSLGRYWYIGPQQTLYAPGPWLKKGRNDIMVFELLEDNQDTLQALKRPILDQLAAPSVYVKGLYDATKAACIVQMETKSPEARIFYTLDGTEPTIHSNLYTSALSFTRPVKIGAKAFRKGIGSTAMAQVEIYPSLSTGKSLSLAHQFSLRYPAGGNDALVDGFRGGLNFADGFWQGYEGSNVEAIVDLGQIMRVNRVGTRYLQDTRSWIFYPASVEYFGSINGVDFVRLGGSEQTVALEDEGPSIKEFEVPVPDLQMRFVRVLARSIGVCPVWHRGAGGKAWIFVDEMTIE
jgi:beta-galactosidase